MNSNCGTLSEDETVHSVDNVMEIEKPTLKPYNATLEEMASRHAFY
jgi:hypothetical protein